MKRAKGSALLAQDIVLRESRPDCRESNLPVDWNLPELKRSRCSGQRLPYSDDIVSLPSVLWRALWPNPHFLRTSRAKRLSFLLLLERPGARNDWKCACRPVG